MGYFDVMQLDERWQKEFTCRAGHPIAGDPRHAENGWQTKALEGVRNYYEPRIYQLTATGFLVFHKELYGSDNPVLDLVTPFSCGCAGDWVDIYTSCKECEKTSPLDPRFGSGHAPVDVTYFLMFNNGQLVKWISEWDRQAQRNNLLAED